MSGRTYGNKISQSSWTFIKKSGDRAYGIYCFNLFKPLQERLEQAEILPKPMLPGSFSQSVEQWGSWENRERRFWSLLERKDGKRLGAIITRFYHDHTRLRLPKKPDIIALTEVDEEAIKKHLLRISAQ